ncbi:exosome complex protein Rrp42 [Candidatus Woesearchaeota archaeon]|nr:exosome complex protein Rrp42 [Candidatus Woesearchaeota archaeon]
MNDITKEHLLDLFDKGFRYDGRKFDEYREISVEYGISSRSAEGSARVKIGRTEVLAGVKMEISEPYPDNPDEGTIMVNAELLPLSNPDFESGPPGIEAIELSRVVDRAIREGKALNFKKLCIKKGEKMWIVMIDIYPVNDDGNLFDAASLAAMAALKDSKFPKVQDEKVNYKETSNEKLPLERLPLSCTIYKIGSHFVVDPCIEEESAVDSRLTVGVLENGELCSLQKGGDHGLTPDDIDNMVEIAIKKTKEIRKAL